MRRFFDNLSVSFERLSQRDTYQGKLREMKLQVNRSIHEGLVQLGLPHQPQ